MTKNNNYSIVFINSKVIVTKKFVKEAWYDLIRTTKSEEGCGWDSMLKVFIVLCDCATGTLATDISVAEQLGKTVFAVS